MIRVEELPEQLTNLLVLTCNIRLLVLKEKGSQSIILEDISQHKFEVIIDKHIKCSCNEGAPKHCVHIVIISITQVDICVITNI